MGQDCRAEWRVRRSKSDNGRPTAVFRPRQIASEKQPFDLIAKSFDGGYAICVCGQESRARRASIKIPSNWKQPGPRSEDASRIVSRFRCRETVPGRPIKLLKSLAGIKKRGKWKIDRAASGEDSRQALFLVQSEHLKMLGRALSGGHSVYA